MILRLAVIGAALVVMGLAHVFDNSPLTAVIGGVVLAVAAILAAVQHRRGRPLSTLTGGGRR
jgi:type IV secretory pathway VirB3-like protein